MLELILNQDLKLKFIGDNANVLAWLPKLGLKIFYDFRLDDRDASFQNLFHEGIICGEIFGAIR